MTIIFLIAAYILGCILSFWKFLGLTNHLLPYYKNYRELFLDGIPTLIILASWFGLIVQTLVYIAYKDTCPYYFKFYLKDRR